MLLLFIPPLTWFWGWEFVCQDQREDLSSPLTTEEHYGKQISGCQTVFSGSSKFSTDSLNYSDHFCVIISLLLLLAIECNSQWKKNAVMSIWKISGLKSVLKGTSAEIDSCTRSCIVQKQIKILI